jgi:DNA-directed RNA polymerase specialized sigma24 family protein
LLALLDKETIAILKERLSPEQRADLVMELINPHKPLTTAEKAALAGVSEKTVRNRAGKVG